jgi:hypothetical protein
MKDSHGQTPCKNIRICTHVAHENIDGRWYPIVHPDSHGQTVQPEPIVHEGKPLPDVWAWGHGSEVAKPAEAMTVQDYREYTEREILLGILDFSRRTGWGDPANLGHWLGAAQRWAKERV